MLEVLRDISARRTATGRASMAAGAPAPRAADGSDQPIERCNAGAANAARRSQDGSAGQAHAMLLVAYSSHGSQAIMSVFGWMNTLRPGASTTTHQILGCGDSGIAGRQSSRNLRAAATATAAITGASAPRECRRRSGSCRRCRGCGSGWRSVRLPDGVAGAAAVEARSVASCRLFLAGAGAALGRGRRLRQRLRIVGQGVQDRRSGRRVRLPRGMPAKVMLVPGTMPCGLVR